MIAPNDHQHINALRRNPANKTTNAFDGYLDKIVFHPAGQRTQRRGCVALVCQCQRRIAH